MTRKEVDHKGLLSAWVTRFGPWIISQSDKVSKQYTKHQLRQVLKDLMSAEMTTLAEARRLLLLRLANTSDPVEKVNINARLRYVEEEVRRFSTYITGLGYIQQNNEEDPLPEITSTDTVWMDRFDEFARRQNEPWRRDLLAKAWAKEAEKPGSIGLRALWLIGTMEEDLFHAFASILDLVSEVKGFKVIPSTWKSDEEVIESAIPRLNPATLGVLLYLLNDTGVLLLDAELPSEGETVDMSYGAKSYTVKVRSEASVVMLSPLGERLSTLYEPKFSQLALDRFEEWVKQLEAGTIKSKQRQPKKK